MRNGVNLSSFDEFTLSGANFNRYIPISGNAAGIIGAFRRHAEPHRKYEPLPMSVGQIPLFLLDGVLSGNLLRSAKEKLHLGKYVAIYRPFDIKIKKRAEAAYEKCRKRGFITQSGSVPDWVLEEKQRAEMIEDKYTGERMSVIQAYLEYEKAWADYTAAIDVPPIDADTGREITGDLNEYLYSRAKSIFPLGVESVLEANVKQSSIPKLRYFAEGLESAPAPKGVRQCGRTGLQLSIFHTGPSIDDTIEALCDFCKRRLGQDGMVKLIDIIMYCAETGLYKGNITLYAIGAAMQSFLNESTVYFDSMGYWKYAEIPDISSWFLRIYEKIETRRGHDCRDAALFIDDTTLKQRIERVFHMEPPQRKEFDTLGMAIVKANVWIAENLRYPIAFLDDMLRRLCWEKSLYGENLRQYDAYFTEDQCDWLEAYLPYADEMARQTIKEMAGYDPETTRHNFSNLPKGHYLSVFFTVDEYLDGMQRRPLYA